MATKLNKSQKQYIEQHRDGEVKHLAADTGATQAQVKAFLKTLPAVEAAPPAKAPTAGDFIHYHTSERGQRVVAIMNEAASMRGDAGKKKGSVLSPKNPRYADCLAPSKRDD